MEPGASAPEADALAALLRDARRTELELLDGVSDALLLGTRAHFLEPPIWEMGHVGWFQEWWLLRHLDGAEPLLPGADDIYDAFHVSYRRRWDHRFPSRGETHVYLSDVLSRTLARLERGRLDARDGYFTTLAALHEDMHAENLAAILQTLGVARPSLSAFDRAAANPPVDPAYRQHDALLPGGTFRLGAEHGEPFVFDNEKWAHEVEVAPFAISKTPVTNVQFASFVDDGGYRRREVWGRRGWDWRRRNGVEHPLFWQREGDSWVERRFSAMLALRPWHPVTHVNWYEAEAFCRWAGRRLPSEAEWEMAATWDPALASKRRFPWGDEPPGPSQANLDWRAGDTIDVRAMPGGDSPSGCRQMIGNVWEWVADTFAPYPGFVCDPYREYSEPYFGQKKVLRGGAWTTRSRLIRATWRNFFKPARRNVFAGFRTAAI